MLALFGDGTRWTGIATPVPRSTVWRQEAEKPGHSVLEVVPGSPVLGV